MRKKSINLDPLNSKKIMKGIKSVLSKSYLFFLMFVVFFSLNAMTSRVFSNDFIFEDYLNNSLHTRGCLNLLESDSNLIYKINQFYIDNSEGKSVLPFFINNYPSTFKDITDVTLLKETFIGILLPNVLKVHEEISKEREKVIDINVRLLSAPLTDADLLYIEQLSKKYSISLESKRIWDYTKALEELLARVDIIPLSVVISMAAQETGWGKSRFLLEGNALFGQWIYNNDEEGMVPNERGSGESHAVKSFSTLEDSIRSYYMNINTHSSYRGFRNTRQNFRLRSLPLNPYTLLRQLGRYSESPNYVSSITNIIRSNNLTKYDTGYSFDENYKNICVNVVS